MEAFVAFKFLHILSMFFGVALAISGELVLRRVAATYDVSAIRTTVVRVKPLSGPISGVLFMAGLGFGILAALTGQFDLLRPWLVMSYVAFAAAVGLGFGILDPWVERLERESHASPAESPSDALRAVIEDPRARFASWALMGLVAVFVFLMVVKPFG